MAVISSIKRRIEYKRLRKLYGKYETLTMIPVNQFVENLSLAGHYSSVAGAFVECGVWRGGMSAAIIEVLGVQREVHLFDSFEGLPPAQPIDGENAIAWQQDKKSPGYYDNCRAEEDFAIKAMQLAKATNFRLHKGWFNQTLPTYDGGNIAVLRLDGDWYESIYDSLKYLYPKVVSGGIIILDDYATWDGCTKAVHDYLSEIKSASHICQWNNQVHYILKRHE